jgi:hypothetical protein
MRLIRNYIIRRRADAGVPVTARGRLMHRLKIRRAKCSVMLAAGAIEPHAIMEKR